MSKVWGSTPGREKFFFPIFLVVLFLFCFAFFLPYFLLIGWFQFIHITEASQFCDIFLVHLFSWPHCKTPNLTLFWEI